jgi:hypothetical protein
MIAWLSLILILVPMGVLSSSYAVIPVVAGFAVSSSHQPLE